MKWVMALTAFLTVSVVGQSLVDMSDCYVTDFTQVKGDIIFASPVDTIQTFERFKLVKVEDIADSSITNRIYFKRVITLKTSTGKEFQMRGDKLIYYDTYDAQCIEKKFKAKKYLFYYIGEAENNYKLNRWQLYQLTGLFHDYNYRQGCFTLTSNGKKYQIDNFDFDSDHFITADQYNKITQKYGFTYGRDILDGVVRIGMTKEMVEASWGSPSDYSYYVSRYGKVETWRYGYNIVTFTNERVTSIFVP